MTNPNETPELTEDTKVVDGQSFYNEALTGSGTITTDGTYAAPLPDPTAVRGLGPNRTSGGRRVDIGEANVANLGTPETEDSGENKSASPSPKKTNTK